MQALIDRLFRLEEMSGYGRCPTYLYRWTILRTRWFKCYLHHFVSDDWSLDMHDHPRRFVSIGLWGKYIEDSVYDGRSITRVYRAPWLRSFPATHRHRIRLTDGGSCWTIAIVFSTVREWGYWHGERWFHWLEYVDPRNELATRMKSCVDN